MKVTTEKNPRDCTECRIVGAMGLCGIGGYLANAAFKNKTTPGKILISTLSLVFVSLGVARYRNEFPFNKNNYTKVKELNKVS